MKREEAIQVLQTALTSPFIYGEYADAIRMAIEALSREQKKYDAICKELCELKSDLNLPIEAALAYEKSIGVVSKYAKMGGSK